jgi:nucleoside phosphorylase
MALEDYLESEVAVAVAATAAVLSPRFRRVLRRGAVYGVAGALKATDVVTATARGVASGVSSEREPAGSGDAAEQAPRPATA